MSMACDTGLHCILFNFVLLRIFYKNDVSALSRAWSDRLIVGRRKITTIFKI